MPARTVPARLNVLHVEDNDDDASLFRRCLEHMGLRVEIERAVDGQQALEILRTGGPGRTSAHPHVVVLDLRMPRMDGFEFLRALQEDPALRHLPVVVFSSSRDASEAARVLELRAKAFVEKPAELSAYRAAVRALIAFWRPGERPVTAVAATKWETS